jgi:hypothetical protein
VSAKQRHNAQYQSDVTTISYVFHPRCGETVIVRGRNRHGGEVALTVRQPDGTLAQLPIWMTEDQAAAMMVTQIPRLSLACLRELRLELDAWQSSLCDDSRREGDEHAASAAETSPTRPLRPKDSPVPIAASERTKLLPLVSALLAETLAIIAEAETSDEDHA